MILIFILFAAIVILGIMAWQNERNKPPGDPHGGHGAHNGH